MNHLHFSTNKQKRNQNKKQKQKNKKKTKEKKKNKTKSHQYHFFVWNRFCLEKSSYFCLNLNSLLGILSLVVYTGTWCNNKDLAINLLQRCPHQPHCNISVYIHFISCRANLISMLRKVKWTLFDIVYQEMRWKYVLAKACKTIPVQRLCGRSHLGSANVFGFCRL